ncbi:hypothetical protein D3C81_2036090 [compost metagenome]
MSCRRYNDQITALRAELNMRIFLIVSVRSKLLPVQAGTVIFLVKTLIGYIIETYLSNAMSNSKISGARTESKTNIFRIFPKKRSGLS